ncbi:MAG: YhcH/YjgK/YiaL family protein [Prolixibacteraceae bacterium]|jgi:YhcH/YjgK/YiaL family protein|nr:YhcH/YjgK/YiaL family protein [Prolixibacteraceae bacterium]
MITDRIENTGFYKNSGTGVAKALQYIAETDFTGLAKGKYIIDGELIYAVVNEYETKPEADCKIEAHRNYIDVQFIVSGEEAIGYAPLNGQEPSIAYNDEKDCVFYKVPTSKVILGAGMFAIFYPHDLHQPGISSGTISNVKKVVVKVRV